MDIVADLWDLEMKNERTAWNWTKQLGGTRLLTFPSQWQKEEEIITKIFSPNRYSFLFLT
jgi:hypothetical protein